ncbi:MAG: hypothetical protein PGN16_07390 [Sphingomonas phyllosphaerae]|uniref:hypothetical protein n=1 Tax=Sphingomonas phyllosphaerae TaxID=257003 RepID=UPI002FF46263
MSDNDLKFGASDLQLMNLGSAGLPFYHDKGDGDDIASHFFIKYNYAVNRHMALRESCNRARGFMHPPHTPVDPGSTVQRGSGISMDVSPAVSHKLTCRSVMAMAGDLGPTGLPRTLPAPPCRPWASRHCRRRAAPLRPRLLQFIKQTVLGEKLLRVTTSQQLVQHVLVDCHINGPFHSILASRTKFLTVPNDLVRVNNQAFLCLDN